VVDFNRAIFFDRDGVLINAPIDQNKKPKSINNLNQISFSKSDLKKKKIKKLIIKMANIQKIHE